MGLETRMPLGDALEDSLAASEARFGDMRPDHEKEIVWANPTRDATEYAVIYVHGFSASKAEIRPVPDRVAEALGANLFYTRLPGHGRNGRAMGETDLSEWYDCLDEALEIGRRIGQRIIVISCSTGSTLVTSGLKDADRRDAVVASVLLAPNFKINSVLANIAYLPGAKNWMEKIAGQRRTFEPRNEDQAKWWTTSYPPSSIVPMMELLRDVKCADLSKIDTPVLAIFSNADQVVDARATHQTLGRWGGPVTMHKAPLGKDVDDLAHVIAGDIVSPGNTDWAIETISAWLNTTLSRQAGG